MISVEVDNRDPGRPVTSSSMTLLSLVSLCVTGGKLPFGEKIDEHMGVGFSSPGKGDFGFHIGRTAVAFSATAFSKFL